MNYAIFIFVIKYVVCAVLIFDLYKHQRTKHLIEVIVIGFFASSILLFLNIGISLANHRFNNQILNSSYFIDWISISLFINYLWSLSDKNKVKLE